MYYDHYTQLTNINLNALLYNQNNLHEKLITQSFHSFSSSFFFFNTNFVQTKTKFSGRKENCIQQKISIHQ